MRGAALYFCTIIGIVLPIVKIQEKMDLVQFKNGNHGSLLVSKLLLKGIIQTEQKKSMRALSSKVKRDSW